jgi:hypothetical protein
MAHSPEGLCDLNLSAASWSEDRELEDQCNGMGSSPTCAAAASKALTAPVATAEPAEEGAELLYQQQHALVLSILPLLKSSLERVLYYVFRVQEMKHPRKESPMWILSLPYIHSVEVI